MTTSIDGKERVESAKKLAKAHGVDVLGWNDKAGKEFISVGGDGDKLETLRKELEKAGWHVWPVDEGQGGHFMDFGMRPPSAGSPKNQSDITAVEYPAELGANSNYYHYRGPGGLYLNNLLVFTILPLLIWGARVKPVTAPIAERMGLLCIAVALVLLPFHWVEISGDGSDLTVRKHFFGKRKVVAFANIKQAKIYKQQQRAGYGNVKIKNRFTWFLGINLKSGKSFDLYLPKKKLADLAAFIKRRIAA